MGVAANEGILVGPLVRESNNLVDVMRFMFTFERRRRAKATVSKACHTFVVAFRRAFLSWFTPVADQYFLATFLENQTAQDQPSMALKFEHPGRRTYSCVAPEACWDGVLLLRGWPQKVDRVNTTPPPNILARVLRIPLSIE